MRLLATLVFTVGCGATPTRLRVKALEPSTIVASDNGTLAIHGEGFEPVVTVDLDSKGRTNENTAFTAHLRSASDFYALNVTFHSTALLQASHPVTMVPGSYALDLTAPDGRTTTLDAALQVNP